MKHLDMVGKPCPMPVVRARKVLQAGEGVTVDVDNEVAVQNLRKMADGEGHDFSFVQLAGGIFRMSIGAREQVSDVSAAVCNFGEGLLLVTHEQMGDGDPKLGAMLMKGYIFAQTELAAPPADIVCLNGGAKLTTAGAATVPDLLTLEAKGVRIWTCGTCANFFGITDDLAVGKITDMMNIATMIAGAVRVVTV